ncbi:MAG TPA: CPBP family intramembrane glutamic endopeptidase [Solirubrobacteraceae bacterium]|nr:CPBP family intramembrane glutamic endopeptidase [Solirubrobacteraceae bacterium]
MWSAPPEQHPPGDDEHPPDDDDRPAGVDDPSSEADDIPPWPVWTVPAGLGLGLALTLLTGSIVLAIGAASGASLSNEPPAVNIAESVAQDASFVAAALAFAVFMFRARPADFGFRRVPIGLAVGLFVTAGIGYYVISYFYTVALNIHGRDTLPSGFGVNSSTAALIATTIFVCLVAPIAEELIFRGFIFGALRRIRLRIGSNDLGTWVAAVITGVLFGAAHVGGTATAGQLVQLGFLGFVLCLLRWRTGSLYPGMALHSLNNALAIGVSEHWPALGVIGLIVGAVAVVCTITAPLAAPPLPAAVGGG